ncbi:uncharacterized protein LOC131041213 isoform X2 [Cryptomeria japonica]|uniref:uncharacterized protein LOC131041213 isoform X2 n=1 Tax=Cryptomeria japonica TaxID=3369 RepID=UPI0027DA03FC|nr:uncharacterized protein LOC131041213 isoform X2 [Cryptomeria japonica]
MEDSVQLPAQELSEEKTKTDIPPWEKHATVINMPRFDYQAPSNLLQTSHSGFLITCPIKREKSATKEAIEILQKFFNLSTCTSRDATGFTVNLKGLEKSKIENNYEVTAEEEAVDVVENAQRKRPRMAPNSEEFPSCTMLDSSTIHGSVSEVHCPESVISSIDDPNLVPEPVENPEAKKNSGGAHITESFTGKSFMPSLVKLARNGIIFFSLPGNCSPNIVRVLAEIFQAMNSGEIKAPVWCYRILPVQATCLLKKEDLRNVVVKLVKEHIGDTESKVERPLKMAVLVEVLPLTGVHGSCVAAVSVLPGDLINVKPRLCIKPLVFYAESNKKK